MHKTLIVLSITISLLICSATITIPVNNRRVLPEFPTSMFMADGVLSTGRIFKLGISNTGVYILDANWFQENISIPLNQIDPSLIQIYGQKSGPLSEENSEILNEGLQEIRISAVGLEDGIFDAADYILFFGEGPDIWKWDQSIAQFNFVKNIYSNQNFYFLKFGISQGKRIESRVSGNSLNPSDKYRYRDTYHVDQNNLLGIFSSTHGSGQRWFGPEISNLVEFDISPLFDFSQVDFSYPVRLHSELAVRSRSVEEIILLHGEESKSVLVSSVNVGDVEALHARIAIFNDDFQLTSSSDHLRLQYLKNSSTARAWLDFVDIEMTKNLVFDQNSLLINNVESLGTMQDGLMIQVPNEETTIWDITSPFEVTEIAGNYSSGHIRIQSSNEVFTEYVIFDDAILQRPDDAIEVENQDIKNMDLVDMVIVYHPDFASQAIELANHRKSFSQLEVAAIPVNEVYNAFSSGKQDPTAIRDFVRLLYLRDPGFQYLLLFGDGSYDHRGILQEFSYESFIPTYETLESLDPLLAFPSDDYFALLDTGEGSKLKGDLDISVGRILVRNSQEAQNVINKIINYDIGAEEQGDWKLRIAFLADDEDNNLHINDAERIAKEVALSFPVFNQQKIYWDAFHQESTPGGNRYPEASDKLNIEIEKGLLVVNYLGHGGPRGWSQERVLNTDMINSWSNFTRLPLVITATCSFTGFDDPSLTTAGESTFLNPVGGAVGLFTTVRSVYASKNFKLTQAVFREIFKKSNGDFQRIGQIMKNAKNYERNDNINTRKFFLIGDPSMKLAIPVLKVNTTSINQKIIQNTEVLDTVGALDQVVLNGQIENQTGQVIDDFNGTVEITVYDKPATIQTLKNDASSFVKDFDVQNNVLFKGFSTVRQGMFDLTFKIPVDINYSLGKGKISYYAKADNGMDAGGFSENLVVGGTTSDLLIDDEGPDIQIFLNSVNFQSGDPSGPNPLVIVYLNDDNGINLSTSSIGHEIIAVLDDDTQNTLILNEFYTPDLDDFKKGQLRFRLKDLAIGRHQIKIKAFDISNNPGEEITNFIVTEDLRETITDLSNKPNPFSNQTQFSFRHSLSDNSLSVDIRIFDMMGNFVHQISRTVSSMDGLVDGISWDGLGAGSSKLSHGIYIYQVSITSPSQVEEVTSEFKKMLILK